MALEAGFLQGCARAAAALAAVPGPMLVGRVSEVSGMLATIAGLSGHLAVGDHVRLRTREGQTVSAEIVTLRDGAARAMCHDRVEGLNLSSEACLAVGGGLRRLPVCDGWLGRVIGPGGEPLDGRGPLPAGAVPRPLRAAPPPATQRARLGDRLDLGIPALDLFTTCRRGQRLGLFASAGVGKSTLLAMLARNTRCDVTVLALIGERGREVREFLDDDLGDAGAARCVTIVSTSDESPLRRRDAAHTAMAVAEHFRDAGRSVLLLMDSVTRYCLALREIALAASEPPATRGYPPSVFSDLPRLLERAGNAALSAEHGGSITAFFTVLVEGGDQDEPVADAVRGFLDGHVILDRTVAERGRYPAVDVLRSLSRTVPGCLDAAEWECVKRARATLALHGELADLVRLGAYQPGHDVAADHALALAPRIEALLHQDRHQAVPQSDAFETLMALTNGAAFARQS